MQASINRFLCLCFLCVCSFAWAQPRMQLSQDQSSDGYKSFKSVVQAAKVYAIDLPSPATGISLDIPAAYSFDGMYIVAGSDTFKLSENIHVPEEINSAFNTRTSNLVILEKGIMQFSLYSATVEGEIVVHTIFAGELGEADKKKAQGQVVQGAEGDGTEACLKPASIDQQVWRDGLAEPQSAPRENLVKHMIVHHSATSNDVTDYYAAVRNIYLYHINVNKWDDIGYNYLIAPDGTIFEGREDFNTFGEDNVFGAHFCAKNSGTMGICMIGDYSGTVLPTEAALSALKTLLAWKANKEALNVNDSYPHPNAGSEPLGVIAGHRNGCATQCPGENMYARLADIRAQVDGLTLACRSVASAENNIVNARQIQLIPNPAHGQVQLSIAEAGMPRYVSVSDIMGVIKYKRQLTTPSTSAIELDIAGLQPGLYFVAVETDRGRYLSRLIVN